MQADTKHIPLFRQEVWRSFGTYFSGLYLRIAANVTASAAQVVLIIPILLLVKYAFDTAIPGKDVRMLVYIGLAMVLLRILNSLITIWLRKVNIGIINQGIYRLRRDIVSKLYALPRSFHTREDHNILHVRIVQDTERLVNMGTALISRLVPALLISAALCLVLIWLNWLLFLVILLTVPVIYFSNRIIGKRIKEKVFIFQRSFEKFSKGILFVLRYVDLTHMHSASRMEEERQSAVLQSLETDTGRMSFIFALNAQLQELLTGITGIIIIIMGGIAVASGIMTLGEFISFYLAALYLNKYMNIITGAFPEVLAGNESMSTLYELTASPEQQPYHGQRKAEFNGNIRMEDVEFSYGRSPLFRSLNFSLGQGQRIAITGPNGSGKTTLIHLIMGFYAPVKGRLLAEEIPYDLIDIQELRKSIGIVPQHPLLFSGTIYDNISYGSDAGPEKVIIAARMALAHEFITGLPNGYETLIGDDGITLSGGEGQRIAIARALLRDPALLILDEPTNHLDHESVGEIMNNIFRSGAPPATLIISHDNRVVSFADGIYHLDKGTLRPVAKEIIHSKTTTGSI